MGDLKALAFLGHQGLKRLITESERLGTTPKFPHADLYLNFSIAARALYDSLPKGTSGTIVNYGLEKVEAQEEEAQ